MENNQIKETITQQLSQINQFKNDCKEQTKALYAQIKSIEDSFNRNIKLIENKIENIKEQYYQFAWDLAIENQKAPRTRSGGYMTPDEVSLDEEGIHITWYESNPYGRDYYDYFSASWDEILEFKKQTEQL